MLFPLREGSRESGMKKSDPTLSHEEHLLYSLLKDLVLLFTFKPLIHPESISVVSEKQGFLYNSSFMWITDDLRSFFTG